MKCCLVNSLSCSNSGKRLEIDIMLFVSDGMSSFNSVVSEPCKVVQSTLNFDSKFSIERAMLSKRNLITPCLLAWCTAI